MITVLVILSLIVLLLAIECFHGKSSDTIDLIMSGLIIILVIILLIYIIIKAVYLAASGNRNDKDVRENRREVDRNVTRTRRTVTTEDERVDIEESSD